MLTATCTLAFHGFLWCNEFTIGLACSSVRICALPAQHIELCLSASKTDPFRRGVTFTIGASQGPCCAVTSLARYLQATPGQEPNSPLFVFSSGLPLSCPAFTQQVQCALAAAGVDNSSLYLSHSFRIGAATTATESGIPAWLIKTIVRWSCGAYQVYTRTPLVTYLAIAQR